MTPPSFARESATIELDSFSAREELAELSDPSAYSADETPVPGQVLALGEVVIRQTEKLLGVPEVVGLENGNLSLFWRLADGFASIEMDETRFGSCVRRSGATVLLFNGTTSELSDFIARGMLVAAGAHIPSSTSWASISKLGRRLVKNFDRTLTAGWWALDRPTF